MNRPYRKQAMAIFLAALLALPPVAAVAQVPVDDDGKPLGNWSPEDESPAVATGAENIPLLDAAELAELVGPIALYPDDLLAVVLPASAYPLQIVEAGRFLEDLEADASLQPNSDWDDSVVALLNYPEVVQLLNEDIDWTWRLGETVVAQQEDVVAAIEAFRDRAYAAGNLKTDDYQKVSRDSGVIEITPVSDDVIYVPYYEPERVVVYQPRPVYYYYPRAYPVYYYPYPSNYYFDNGLFWGVTTAFTIGWFSDSLHVYHHSYHGHPYYGHHYYDYWWYRRPSIYTYNTTYVNRSRVTINNYYQGDRWHPRRDRRDYVRNDYHDYRGHRDRNRHDRETHNRYYSDTAATRNTVTTSARRDQRRDQPVRFRERPETRQYRDGNTSNTGSTARQRTNTSDSRDRGERGDAVGTAGRAESRGDRRETQARERRQEPVATRQRSGASQASHDTRRQNTGSRERRQEPITFARRNDQGVRNDEGAERRESRPQPTHGATRSDVRQTQRNDGQRSEPRRSEPQPVQRETRQRSDVRQTQRNDAQRSAPRRSEPQPVQRETRQRSNEQRGGSDRQEKAPQPRNEKRSESRGRTSRDDSSKTRERRH